MEIPIRMLSIIQPSVQTMLKMDEELGPHVVEISKGNLQVPMRQTRGPTIFLYHGLRSDLPSKILFLNFQVRSKEQHTGL